MRIPDRCCCPAAPRKSPMTAMSGLKTLAFVTDAPVAPVGGSGDAAGRGCADSTAARRASRAASRWSKSFLRSSIAVRSACASADPCPADCARAYGATAMSIASAYAASRRRNTMSKPPAIRRDADLSRNTRSAFNGGRYGRLEGGWRRATSGISGEKDAFGERLCLQGAPGVGREDETAARRA